MHFERRAMLGRTSGTGPKMSPPNAVVDVYGCGDGHGHPRCGMPGRNRRIAAWSSGDSTFAFHPQTPENGENALVLDAARAVFDII